MARSPISRVGGKFYLANKIIPLFPPHKKYIEPFGGAMHILFRKEPSQMEVYNDIDGSLVNFFTVVKCCPGALSEQLDYSLYSRGMFLDALDTMNTGTDVERASKFYIVNRQCFGGKMETWGLTSAGGDGYFKYERRIREAHNRLKHVYIENLDWRNILERYDAPDAFFYLDPPYIFNEHRSSRRAYENEMSHDDHKELSQRLKRLKGKFVLSGYENALYGDFKCLSVGSVNMCVNRATGGERIKKQEFIWKNF